MEKLSLYSKVKKEKQRWDNLSDCQDVDADQLDILTGQFRNEQTAIWVAAALSLGKIAAKNSEAEGCLQMFMLDVTNYHILRHAFTAIGVYAASLDDDDRKFVFLNKYKNFRSQKNKNGHKKEFDFEDLKQRIMATKWGQKQENKEKLFKGWSIRESLVNAVEDTDAAAAVNKYFEEIVGQSVKCAVAGAKTVVSGLLDELLLLERLKGCKTDSFIVVKSKETSVKSWWEEEGRKKIENQIKGRERRLNGKSNQSELDIQSSQKIQDVIDNLKNIMEKLRDNDSDLKFQEILETTGTNIEHIAHGTNILKAGDLEEWTMASFVLSFHEAQKLMGNNFDLSDALRCLMAMNRPEYLKNIPFILMWQMEQQGQTWEPAAKMLIKKINSGNINFNNFNIHLHAFLIDILIIFGKMQNSFLDSADKFFYDFISQSKLIPDDYIKRIGLVLKEQKCSIAIPKAAELLISIFDTFCSEQRWRSKSIKESNLLFFIPLLFDIGFGLPLDRKASKSEQKIYDSVLSEQRKDQMVASALRNRLDNNPDITIFLIRILKERFFLRLMEIRPENPEEECLRQFYAVTGVLKGWRWGGTVYKDIGIILANIFEKASEFKKYNLIRKLYYFLFYQNPEKSFLNHMQEFINDSYIKNLFENTLILMDMLQHHEQRQELLEKGCLWKQYREIACQLWMDKTGNDNNLDNNWDKKNTQEKYADIDKEKIRINVWENIKSMLELKDTGGCPCFNDLIAYSVELNFSSDNEFGAYNTSKEEKKEFDFFRMIKIQEITNSFRETHLQLKEIIRAFDDSFNSYKDFIESEGLYEKLIFHFNDALIEVNNHLPLIERNLLYLSLSSMKHTLKERDSAISKIMDLFNSGNDAEAGELHEMLVNPENCNEKIRKKFCNIYKVLGNWKDDTIRKTTSLVENYMYQRFMLSDIAKNRYRFSDNNIFYRVYNYFLLPIPCTLALMFLPFILTVIGNITGYRICGFTLGEFGFGAYFIVIQLFIISCVVFFPLKFVLKIIVKFVKQIVKRKERSEIIGSKNYNTCSVKQIGRFDMLLPKLFGMLFIAFPTIFFSDEMWSIACGNKWIPNLILCALFMLITFFFINHTMLGHIHSAKSRMERAFKVFSLGIIESFVVTMFYTIKIGAVMSSSYRGCMETMGKKAGAVSSLLPASINFSIPEHYRVLTWLNNHNIINLNFTICPRLILIWTFKLLFVSVILQLFISKDQIIDRD